MALFGENCFRASLPVRVRSIVVFTQLLADSTSDSALAADVKVSDSDRAAALEARAKRFKELANEVSKQAALHNDAIGKVLVAAGIPPNEGNVVRILTTWLDTSATFYEPSHLFFLFVGLLMARAMIETRGNPAVRYVLQFVNETLFGLVVYLKGYDPKEVAFLFSTILPKELASEEVTELFRHHPELIHDCSRASTEMGQFVGTVPVGEQEQQQQQQQQPPVIPAAQSIADRQAASNDKGTKSRLSST